MSKFERYKKQAEEYIYPHKHCKKCGQLIEEAYSYCSDCYSKLKEKKKRKLFSFLKKKRKNEEKQSQ
ncbi:MAG: DUF2116 family Zn-ribbon domain-containing protein [Candidatus Thorarchaeota archaeon]